MSKKTFSVVAGVCAMLVGGLPSVRAQVQQPVRLDIVSQPLSDALRELATVSNTNIVFEPGMVNGITAPALKGSITPEEALSRLLSGTKWSFKFVDENTVSLIPRAETAITSTSALLDSQDFGGVRPSVHEEMKLARNFSADDGAAVGDENAQASGHKDDVQSAKLEEIVVSAQRRDENLQDVPISISVLSGQQLDTSSATSLADALLSVPGLSSTQSQFTSGSVNFALRGVSNPGPRSSGAGVVAFYLDGVPYGFIRSAYAPDPNIYDLAQVEVLSGPQGTLYGAGSLNGVVRVLTHTADVDDFEFKARAFASTTEDGGGNEGGDFAVNVPVVPGLLGARAVLGYRDDSGWIDAPNRTDVNDDQMRSYRLRLRAEPTDMLSMDFSVWRFEDEIGAPNIALANRTITSLQDQSQSQEFTTYGLNIAQEFSTFTLTSATSFIDFNNQSLVDGTPSGVAAISRGQWKSEVFAQEFNLVSNLDGPWSWSAGAFYRKAEEGVYQVLDRINPALADAVTNDYADESTSYAIYGELGRDLTEMLHLSAGLRYFHDEGLNRLEKEYSSITTGITLPAGTESEFESEAITPRVVLTWTPSEDQTFYASVSQGFRSGLAQQPNVQVVEPQFQELEPDLLTNYEIGNKGELLEGRVSYRAALFYIDWRDQQLGLRVRLDNGLVTDAQVNSGSASGVGAEFGVTYRPFDSLHLGLTGSWNDVTTDNDIVRNNANGTDTLLFSKGDRFQFSPEYTVGADAGYKWSLGGNYVARISGSANYTAPEIDRAMISAGSTRASDHMFIAAARLSVEAPHWRITLFGDNLADEAGTTRHLDVPEWSDRRRPMTCGLQLEYRYGE